MLLHTRDVTPSRTTEGDRPTAETTAASPVPAGPALTPNGFPGRVATPAQVLALQRTAGNRAVTALLQRAPAEAPPEAPTAMAAPAPPADKPMAIQDPLLPHAVEWRAMIAEGQQQLRRIGAEYPAFEHAQRIVAVANSVHVADAGGQMLGHFPLRSGWRLPPGVYGMDRTRTMVFHANLDMTGIRFRIADLPEEMRKTAEKSKSIRPEDWIKIDRNASHLFDGLTLILVAEVATPTLQEAVEGHVQAPLEEDVGTQRAGYGAEIDEGKGSGKVAPLPPLSAHLTGLDKQPDGGTGSFGMHINFADVPGGDLAGASWARKPISYGWQLWKLDKVKAPDVARAEAQARRAAGAKAEDVGTWDSYGHDTARRWGDVADHAQQYEEDRAAAQREGRQMDELSNQLNQGMFSVEVLSTVGTQIVDTVGKLFADKREREIGWDRGAGYYFVRCVAYIDPAAADAGGTWRPPSVATKVIRVQDLDSLSQEAVGEGEARLAEQRAKIAAQQEVDRGAGADPDQDAGLHALQLQLDQMELALVGPANKAIRAEYEKRKAECERAKVTSPSLKHGHRDRDVEKLERQVSELEKQLELAETRHQELAAGGAEARRMQATLVSRITGEQYPLVLEVNAPRRGADGSYVCTVSDVTTKNGGKATGGHPSDPVDAVWNACTAFAHGDGSEQYGEGSLSIRLPADYLGADPLSDVRRTHVFESKTHNWGATKKRLEELATILGIVAVLGAPELAVVGALIGGAVAAANLYERWQNDTLRPDASLISDVLSVLSALTAGTTSIGKLTLIRGPGGKFVLVATEEMGRVASTVHKFDDWLLNPAGLLWGNAQVIDGLLAINAAEEAGTLSSTDARRQRASLFTTMLNTNLGLVAHLKGHHGAGAADSGGEHHALQDRPAAGEHAASAEPGRALGETQPAEPGRAPDEPTAAAGELDHPAEPGGAAGSGRAGSPAAAERLQARAIWRKLEQLGSHWPGLGDPGRCAGLADIVNDVLVLHGVPNIRVVAESPARAMRAPSTTASG